jgi:hypothetical protein
MLIDQSNRARCSRIRNSEEPARKVRRKRWQTSCGFRLIRAFTPDHNAARWLTHYDRMSREWKREPGGRKVDLRMRRVNRSKGASA